LGAKSFIVERVVVVTIVDFNKKT